MNDKMNGFTATNKLVKLSLDCIDLIVEMYERDLISYDELILHTITKIHFLKSSGVAVDGKLSQLIAKATRLD